MSCRRGIEDDMIVSPVQRLVGQEAGELVERRDLRCAGARKLLPHILDGCLGQHAAVRRDDALTILLRCLDGIEVGNEKARRLWYLRSLTIQGQRKHILQVGSRIRTHQQDAFTVVCEIDGCGARSGRLAPPAFPSEKQIFRLDDACGIKSFHDGLPPLRNSSSLCPLLHPHPQRIPLRCKSSQMPSLPHSMPAPL